MKSKHILSLGLLLLCLTSCLHTAKVTQKFTAGSSLTSSDVVLFTGYNGESSSTSKIMFNDTQRHLAKCGIKVVYMHDPNLNYEFLKAGFTPTPADVDNDDFIYRMREVYGVTHLFSIGSVGRYNGNTMDVQTADIVYGGSGVVFEVYSLAMETHVASMKISGKTWRLHRDGEVEQHPDGSIHVNYAKGLKTLMKSAVCQ